MESKTNYQKVYISFRLSEESNKLLSESCERSGRKKIPEAALRLADHLNRFRSISELNHVIPITNSKDVKDDDTPHK